MVHVATARLARPTGTSTSRSPAVGSHDLFMAETAQTTFARLLRDVVAPALRAEGLRGSGMSYVLPDPVFWGIVGFQESMRSDADVVKFTVNLTATAKEDWDEWRRDHSYAKDT